MDFGEADSNLSEDYNTGSVYKFRKHQKGRLYKAELFIISRCTQATPLFNKSPAENSLINRTGFNTS